MNSHVAAAVVLVAAWACGGATPVHLVDDEGIDSSENLLETEFGYLGESVFGFPDMATGEKVSNWSLEMSVNPEELGEYMEGDILFHTDDSARNGLTATSSRWPGGVVYYDISQAFNNQERAVLQAAFDDYHRLTCVRFLPWSGQRDCLRILKGSSGCWSAVGRVGGTQDLNLQSPSCLARKGTAIHELMHALGFNHEHTRWERDSHVAIYWNNIQRGRENNFQKASKSSADGLGIPYDYSSVMHYSQYAFSVNSQPTIEPTVRGVKVGQRDGLSKGDIEKINRMYNCRH